MSDIIMNLGATPNYADLASRMRGIDKFECRATNGHDPEEALRWSISQSSKWWVGVIDGQEEFAVGVAPMRGCAGWGAPWMLSSDKPFRRATRFNFLRRTRDFVREASEGYDVLFNIVSEANTDSIAWLEFAGFLVKREDALVYGMDRFFEFIRVTPGGQYDPAVYLKD